MDITGYAWKTADGQYQGGLGGALSQDWRDRFYRPREKAVSKPYCPGFDDPKAFAMG